MTARWPLLFLLLFSLLHPLFSKAGGLKTPINKTNKKAPITQKITAAQPYDIVITEIMADPTPEVGLPNAEWIELKNTSSVEINLQGWRIGDAAGMSGLVPNCTLQPDSVVIVCAASSVVALSAFGKAVAVTSFPSLGNDGDELYVLSLEKSVIHALRYSANWYQNELKKAGGWSLEMIDTHNPCGGAANWKASTDAKGGTPGTKNSIDAINADKMAPQLLRAFAEDSLHLTLVFNESLDSAKAAVVAHFSVSDGIGAPAVAMTVAPFFDKIMLQLNTPILTEKVYTVSANGLTDCAGNGIGVNNSARVGVSAAAGALDILVNEILFNPPMGGSDYVELYNRSNKIIDLKQTYMATRNTAGTLSSIAPIAAENFLLFPKDFMVLTPDIAFVQSKYLVQNPDAFIGSNLPSFNDDKGCVVILNAQGDIIDELNYSEKWHFNLLTNTEGIALERISYDGATNVAENWHSAASSSGYGTPGFKNSQMRNTDAVSGAFKISPDIFSPDNDGQDDFATIDYLFEQAGYVANISVFDAAGRLVRQLQRNAICGTKGSFRWDGLGEKQQALPAGIYIVYASIFNLQGATKQYKMPVVLARRY